ncbi:unnamed protein product [Rotaria magnacalcarata]|uniref:SCP domain-containing protein n=1 Tax=Rotaria magnacalcarata TaxID=392030 RepID=A0A815W223_9BILA|nr:unnamed protein product [Rotaria magnacalcarata]CAF1537630.1 unnamed protein product [Rotaria magnacalcarata]CAF2129111.1 unnamed protein product [Rotaria magnacalcarata]CAF4885620.1 unnamed protein product [Rotaria magnacalcarata]CAF5096763.1 unnamed protein product [Rotaria magnacalcarata]
MKVPVVGILLLTLFTFNNARVITHDHDHESYSNSDEETLIRRYFAEQYRLLRQEEDVTFTEDFRKFQNDSLVVHNTLRAHHCVPPLELDEEINIKSQIYANHLASTDSPLIHSTNRGSRFGENLYSLTRKSPIANISAEKIVLTWYAEIEFYDYSKPAYKMSTGHFTQIVWKDTRKMGVGYAFGREGRKVYIVAQYEPPGNYRHRFGKNVLEPKC